MHGKQANHQPCPCPPPHPHQMRQYRKDIAELLRAGKQDYARIRVEAVIREVSTQTGYEILELYLELLAVRAPLIASTKVRAPATQQQRRWRNAIQQCMFHLQGGSAARL